MTPKDILQLESTDIRQAYLFEENGHWYAYEHSANRIEKFVKGFVDLQNKVTTKKWNTEECSNRIDLQRFHLSCRFSPTPPQSLQKPNQDVATLLVRNHTI